MSIKNNKVYIFAIIIFIWNTLYNYLQNTTNYYNILNFIFLDIYINYIHNNI